MSGGRTFLGHRALADVHVMNVNGATALESFQRMRNVIIAERGEQVASIFAQPEFFAGHGQGDAHVCWYSPLQGEVRLLDDMDEADAARVAATLSDRLQALAPLRDHPDVGGTLGCALHLLSRSSLLAIGDQPVLVDWGMAPPAVARDGAYEQHFATLLGAVAPGLQGPDVPEQWAFSPRSRRQFQDGHSNDGQSDSSTNEQPFTTLDRSRRWPHRGAAWF